MRARFLWETPKRWPARSIGAVFLLASATAVAADDTPSSPIELTYSPWTKFCQDAAAKQVCFTGTEGRTESGQPVIAAVIMEPDGEPKKILRVTLPLGMQLVPGTRVIVDNNPPQRSPYVTCSITGCISDYELTAELLANLKKGQNLIVQAINSKGAPLTFSLPLAEFAKAYDGPPMDPSVWEQHRKELEDKARKPVLDDTLAPRYRPKP